MLARCSRFYPFFFVMVSVFDLIIGSMPTLQGPDREPLPILQDIENVCMLWFTFEFVSRFTVSPKKYEFLKVALNLIDVFTIVPFYFEAIMGLVGVSASKLSRFQGAMVVIRVLRVARVLRVFKFARYSLGLRAFGDTMRSSLKELGMLSMFLLTGIILFSTSLYFMEKDEAGTSFTSIPAACWWCVITMTTVGYGDMTPVTAGGKCIASVASVCGIIVLAFPISMIIDKFADSTERAASNASGVEKIPLPPQFGGGVGGTRNKTRRRVGMF